MTDFVSLHNQTDFSILDSIISVKELFNKAKELGQSAVAITDHGTLAAVWDALKVSRETGVKLIVGCEMYFRDVALSDDRMKHLVLIAKNATGYKNLLTLNKKGFDNNVFPCKRVYPVIDWKLLEEHKDGLICLTACGNGILSQPLMNGKFDEAEASLLKLKTLFKDDLGIEIQPNNMKRNANNMNDMIDQQFLNRRLIDMAKKHDIKIIPACNAHYLNKEDNETHDVLLSIGARQPIYSGFRLKYNVPDFYMKTGDEVKAFFARNYGEDFAEQICSNTVEFANRCEIPDWIDPKFSNPSGKELPIFPVKDETDFVDFLEWKKTIPDNIKNLEDDKLYLRYKCQISFDNKKNLSGTRQEYLDRIDEELDVLEFHGFSSYMLIVADYINWSRKNGVAVGAGRGSAGGSLIAYLLGIHEADPIKYNLIFARFHNKEKSSFPDIDTDFAPSGRAKVQDYLKKKYGEDHVAHVSNVNTITPKVFIKDIARSCELGGSREEAVVVGNSIADMVPADIKSIDDALLKIPLFAEYCKKYPEFIRHKKLCGKYRAWSTHAGGIIISARPLTGLVPVRKDKEGNLALEYDKERAEENGLVKMDTLGLSTLDIISKTMELIKEAGKPDPVIDYDSIDSTTYDLVTEGNTFCVFQLGTSGGTIDLCKRIKPKSINDISYVNSLARPSARDMRNDFIATKDGKKKFTLLDPKLGRAFNNTFGFGLYEESLMYLAQDIAGWSLHSADRLRKLTKEKGKNPKKAAQWREEFINDAVGNNVNQEVAKRIWDEVIEKFQGYGFNQSHSILYSMISYKTAFLKAHYPVEFLLANLMAEVESNTPDAKANIDKIKKEMKEQNVKLLPPNLNSSGLTYKVFDGDKLSTGLDALKFVSTDAIEDIISKRPFKDFQDFMVRVDSKKVRSNTIQALASAGCLSMFGLPRKAIFLYCSDYRKKLNDWSKKHNPETEKFTYPFDTKDEWDITELYALEQQYLGDAFICAPHVAYGNFFKSDHLTVTDIKNSPNKTKLAPIRAIVKDFFEFKVKKETSKYYGMPMVKAVVEDKNGNQCSCTIFPDRWAIVQDRLKSKRAVFEIGLAISFGGSCNSYEDEMGFILEDLFAMAPPPQPPKDLKAKKISLRKTKEEKLAEAQQKATSWQAQDFIKNLENDLEDDLYEGGFIDLEEDFTEYN